MASNLGRYRTFVQLNPDERWILRLIQRGIINAGHEKPPLSRLIGSIIKEYWEAFEKDADPKMLEELKKQIPPPWKSLLPELGDFTL